MKSYRQTRWRNERTDIWTTGIIERRDRQTKWMNEKEKDKHIRGPNESRDKQTSEWLKGETNRQENDWKEKETDRQTRGMNESKDRQ